MSILIVGGYGGFGARLSRRLAAVGQPVIVAGRNRARAERFAATLPGARGIAVDRIADLAPVLAAERPRLVIDAAGPFQASGMQVPAACIAAGVPYLDLADARDFVCGIAALDGAARGAGVPVIAGASSVPALSGAVVRRLSAGMERVTAVEAAISASNQATAGPSVAAAILAQVGRPIRLWRGGRWDGVYGWQSLRRLAAPPLVGPRLVATADVPDLALLPDRLPGRPAVIFRAGTELAFQNLALWLASWPVRWRLLPGLGRFAVVLRQLQRPTARLGSDRSFMVVRVFGLAAGRRVERRWTLVATEGRGPEVPTLAAAILAERILAGAVPPGARDAGETLDLADFDTAFDTLGMVRSEREIGQPPPLYARVMDNGFDALAPAVAAMHGVLRDGGATGHGTVERGCHPLARLVAAVMRFPPAGDYPLHVAFAERGGAERWTRDFGGHRFSSRLSRRGCWLEERFGPLRFRFDLPVADGGLAMVLRGWSCMRVPLPLMLAPRIDAREWEADGRFRFDVAIALPLVGRVIRYRGVLDPV